MKNRSAFIITLVLFALVSCSKDTTTIVEIVVTEKGSNTFAVGIPVNFVYSSTGGLFSGQVAEQTKTTDSDGRVSFKAERDNESYSVGFPNGADYFGDGVSLKEGDNGTVFLNTHPFAYVRVHAKNTSPFDGNDWIDITSGLLGGEGQVFMV